MKAVGRIKAEPRSKSYPLPISGQYAFLWECSPKAVGNELASNRTLTSACMKAQRDEESVFMLSAISGLKSLFKPATIL